MTYQQSVHAYGNHLNKIVSFLFLCIQINWKLCKIYFLGASWNRYLTLSSLPVTNSTSYNVFFVCCMFIFFLHDRDQHWLSYTCLIVSRLILCTSHLLAAHTKKIIKTILGSVWRHHQFWMNKNLKIKFIHLF